MRYRGWIVVVTIAAASGCVHRPPDGGVQEQALAAAALAGDVARVTQLLEAGADANKLVPVQGRPQSPWYAALDQLRPGRPAFVAVVMAMLAHGASPNVAWGTGGGDVSRLSKTFWQRMMSARSSGTGGFVPLDVALRHPVPEVLHALLKSGADPRGHSLELVDAIESGQDDIARLLVDAGADVNGHAGPITPLVAAIEARNVAMMTFLEQHGAREKP